MNLLKIFLLAIFFFFSLLGGALVDPDSAFALEKPGENLKKVGLTTHNGDVLDLSLPFIGADGVERPLQDYMLKDKPTIIVPAYYTCPRLCGLLLDGMSELLLKMKLPLGEDFRVVTVSFDPEDTTESLKRMAEKYHKPISSSGRNAEDWIFLRGQQQSIIPFMEQLGFRYKEDEGEFAHTAAIFILTPGGKISQYFTGISFPFRDVRLALVEASAGKIGTLLDHALLFCFRFDPSQGKYTWAAFNVMRAGGGLTFFLLVGLIFWLRKREKITAEKTSVS